MDDLKPLSMRDPREIGHLWENYILVERLKYHEYSKLISGVEPRSYFWRTYEQQEIDFILEADGLLELYEAKFNAKKNAKIPPQWLKHYPEFQELKLIHTRMLIMILML